MTTTDKTTTAMTTAEQTLHAEEHTERDVPLCSTSPGPFATPYWRHLDGDALLAMQRSQRCLVLFQHAWSSRDAFLTTPRWRCPVGNAAFAALLGVVSPHLVQSRRLVGDTRVAMPCWQRCVCNAPWRCSTSPGPVATP
eukprot:278793-Chlamydomonas_euryale.AAC.2